MRNSEQTLRKHCSRCGADFTCIVKAGCWCENLNISRKVLSQLRMRYADCLCPACLVSFEDKADISTPLPDLV